MSRAMSCAISYKCLLENPEYRYAKKDAEVLILGEIPKNAILFIKREGMVKL